MTFHEVRFPTAISRGAQGTLERRTDVVVLGSGYEERNGRWADSRRMYNAGYGVKTLIELYEVMAFFEERRGRLHGFRWRDPLDATSGAPGDVISPLDQQIGTGDGVTTAFQLKKRYGSVHAPWSRDINKPVTGSVRVAVNGVEKTNGPDFTLDQTTGQVIFSVPETPANGVIVTAGYAFDVPVRFDTDRLDINLSGFRSGAIPNIPIVEVRL